MSENAPGSVSGGQGVDSAQVGRESDIALTVALMPTPFHTAWVISVDFANLPQCPLSPPIATEKADIPTDPAKSVTMETTPPGRLFGECRIPTSQVT
jgi:hypothetical protein